MPRLTNLMLSSYAFENKKKVTVDKKSNSHCCGLRVAIGAFSQFFAYWCLFY